MDAAGAVLPDDIRALVESIAPQHRPTTDVAALRDCARRCRAIAEQLGAHGTEMLDAHRSLTGSGALHDAIGVGIDRLAGQPDSTTRRAVAEVRALADAVDRFADSASSAQMEMAVIASIADRDRLRADLMSHLGDDSARVMAAAGGRMALTAAGDEYVDSVDGQNHHHHDDGQPAPAATSGMMPFAAMGGLAGGAVAGAAFGHVGSGESPDGALADADLDWLQRRAAHLQANVPASCGDSVHMAVGIGMAADGSRTVFVATNELGSYLRAGVEPTVGEVCVGNGRAAELALADQVSSHGMRLLAVASASPVAPSVVDALEALDAAVLAPASVGDDYSHWPVEPSVGEHH